MKLVVYVMTQTKFLEEFLHELNKNCFEKAGEINILA